MVEQIQSETTSLDEQIAQRTKKLATMKAQGQAYPNDFKKKDFAKVLHGLHESKDNAQLESEHIAVSIAGRIMLRRKMGKASFLHIQDSSGRIQLYIRKDALPEGEYDELKTWDIGDIIGATGILFKTKTGELSIKVEAIRLLTKSLRPLPDKWHGLSDQEMRYRQRYIDLLVNDLSRQVFITRTKVIQFIRNFLNDQQFMEVETPMMQVIPGGATARPFVTHHNALDMDLYLRVAPELYLKRLVVGGFERVFEINRNFRNEGLSTQHNPEFTMVEFYQAYATYEDLMDLTEVMLRELAKTLFNQASVIYQDKEIDFSSPFKRLTIVESLLAYNQDISKEQLLDKAQLTAICQQHEISIDNGWGLGRLQLELFEKTVEHQLLDPTFITAYPREVSPLARANDVDPNVTDRFELFIAGREIANGFSELNDPQDQAERFKQQVVAKDAGDMEAMHFDADYIRALEVGMPPTAGEGIGIDRLVMLMTNTTSIREVLLFPHMRKELFS